MKNLKIDQEKLSRFIERFPLLISTIKKLNEAKLDWMIGGSGCLYLLGNERIPDDVDIYLPNFSHDKADELFKIKSFFYKSDIETVRNSNPEGDHSIQLTSQIRFNLDGEEYNLEVTNEMINQRIEIGIEGNRAWLLSPEDVLLIKALLQRGPEVGKHDLEDIRKFVEIYSNFDQEYISKRIETLKAEDRVGKIFS